MSNLLLQVKKLAHDAGTLALNKKDFTVTKKGEFDFVTEIDIQVSNMLCKKLPLLIEGSSIISEEEPRPPHTADYVWIIDPIDGTTNFIQGINKWAVSIGLVYKGSSVLGLVYSPTTDEMFYAEKGNGAFLNNQQLSVSQKFDLKKSIILCETNPYGDRQAKVSMNVISRVFENCTDIRVLGSAALDLCYVACGKAEATLSENLKPWDYAAGIIILEEAGGKITDWDGKTLGFEEQQTVLASNGKLHSAILSLVKQ